jgi:alpha-amylase/alpha-mannosidase (GH57 family)
MKKNICIHGHFYQPPRENAWLEEVEQQDSAYPYHDWNTRITAECYSPNAAARIVDNENKILDIINNYSMISFNFGPTLLSWLKKNEKELYRAIIQADITSQSLFSGHGSAIAQCYNHMIMPLANSRDKKTQIIWGLKDFEYHFRRKSEGMWLPETAVDDETLELMVEHQIKYVILSPFQAKKAKSIDKDGWIDVTGGKIDTKIPYLYRLPSGKTIVIFFYDGKVSQEIAFSNLLSSGDNFAKRLINAFSTDSLSLVNIAVDGETFGSHKYFGDMALAYCLRLIKNDPAVDLAIYGSFLEKYPLKNEVQIYQNSAWSCAHGVGRWSKDCGCCADCKKGWNQKWREPLRNGMDWLRDELVVIYQREMASFVKDPWHLRDIYIELILNRSQTNIKHFFEKHITAKVSDGERIKILKLLEIQRHAMLMYTSCGWFFDDISRIETQQILSYATRAIQLAEEVTGKSLEEGYLAYLEKAKSNEEKLKDGAYIYQTLIKPKILKLTDVAIDYIISTLFENTASHCNVYSYSITTQQHEIFNVDDKKLSLGNLEIFSHITLEKKTVYFMALHYFSHNILVGISEELSDSYFLEIAEKIKNIFLAKDFEETHKQITKIFSFHQYTFWSLFKEDQRKILKKILWSAISNITVSIENVHQLHYPLLKDMKDRKIPIPPALVKSLDLVLNLELTELLESHHVDVGALKEVVSKILDWSFQIDLKNITFLAATKLETMMEHFSKELSIDLLNNIVQIFQILSPLSLQWNLWKMQNTYFYIAKSEEIFQKGDPNWMELFKKLGEHLKVKLPNP